MMRGGVGGSYEDLDACRYWYGSIDRWLTLSPLERARLSRLQERRFEKTGASPPMGVREV